MYTKPVFSSLDHAVSAASCCRIIVQSGENGFFIVNEPLCPFPAPTGDICVRTADTTIISTSTTICALAN